MIRLSREQVVALHERLIEATGGSNGIRDLASGKIVTKDMLNGLLVMRNNYKYCFVKFNTENKKRYFLSIETKRPNQRIPFFIFYKICGMLII